MFHLAPHRTLNTRPRSLLPASPMLLSSSSPNPDLLSTHPFFSGHVHRKRSEQRDIHSCAKCGGASSFRVWQCCAMLCSTMLARHDDRWKEFVRLQAPRKVAEMSSNEEGPLGHGGALESDEEDPWMSGGVMYEGKEVHDPGRDPPIETDRSNVQHVNRLVQGKREVHSSHETWLLRGIIFWGLCGACGTSTAH